MFLLFHIRSNPCFREGGVNDFLGSFTEKHVALYAAKQHPQHDIVDYFHILDVSTGTCHHYARTQEGMEHRYDKNIFIPREVTPY
jgi:hypothetical protein